MKVLMAFKCGRDSTIFTDRGIISIDVKGFTGKRVEFRNVPYETIRCFAVESAGSFDRDSELKLIFCTPWLPTFNRDFRYKIANISICFYNKYSSVKIFIIGLVPLISLLFRI